MQDKRVTAGERDLRLRGRGISLGSGQLPAEATINITYVNRLERESSWQIEADLRRQLAALPGVTIADAFDSGATALSTIKAPVDIRLNAEDWRLLPDAAEHAKPRCKACRAFLGVGELGRQHRGNQPGAERGAAAHPRPHARRRARPVAAEGRSVAA